MKPSGKTARIIRSNGQSSPTAWFSPLWAKHRNAVSFRVQKPSFGTTQPTHHFADGLYQS
ncbi:hypothetical protein [Neisseria animalis]|uniref:hypothetical protein n=1 Tax=Neisseria animalis TaxID=492 RepID=UPI000F844B9F|nr:hypothetical protein [Neisseria animalis]